MRLHGIAGASFLASMIALAGLPAIAAPGDALVVVGDAVNVRAAPRIDAGIRMRLDRQHLVVEMQREGDWVRVEIAGTGGREGWIHGSLLALPDGERLARPFGAGREQLPAVAPRSAQPAPAPRIIPPEDAEVRIARPGPGLGVEPVTPPAAQSDAPLPPPPRPAPPAMAAVATEPSTAAPPGEVPPSMRPVPAPVAVAIEPQGVAIESVGGPVSSGQEAGLPKVTASLPTVTEAPPAVASRSDTVAPLGPTASVGGPLEPPAGAGEVVARAEPAPEAPARAEPMVPARPDAVHAAVPAPATIEPGAPPADDDPGLVRFRDSVDYLNSRAVSVAGVDLFTGADPVGGGTVQVHATEAWRSIPPAGRESYLNALLDRWAAARDQAGPVSVQIVDAEGTVMMERHKP